MKITETEGWAYGADEEEFSEVCETRADAINMVKEEYGSGCIGRHADVEFVTDDVCTSVTDLAIDRLRDALYDEVGPVSELWTMAPEYEEELHNRIAQTIIDFLNEKGLQPHCFKVLGIEDAEADAEECEDCLCEEPDAIRSTAGKGGKTCIGLLLK